MLHHYVQQFLDYCQIASFSERSIRTLSARLKELKNPAVPLEQRDGESPKFKEDFFILSSLANLYPPLADRCKQRGMRLL